MLVLNILAKKMEKYFLSRKSFGKLLKNCILLVIQIEEYCARSNNYLILEVASYKITPSIPLKNKLNSLGVWVLYRVYKDMHNIKFTISLHENSGVEIVLFSLFFSCNNTVLHDL